MSQSCQQGNEETASNPEEKAAKDCGKSGESWRPKTVPELGPERKCGLFMSADVDSSQGGLL